jgi:hypothetical protein
MLQKLSGLTAARGEVVSSARMCRARFLLRAIQVRCPQGAVREKVMKKLSLISLACATALAICPSGLAAQTWDFTFTYGSVVATGTLTAGSVVAPGEYNITSGTIDVTGSAIDGTGVLVPIPASGVFETGGGTNLFGFGATDFEVSNLYPNQNPQINDVSGVLLFAIGGFNTVTGAGPGSGLAIWSNGPGNYGGFGGNWTFNDLNGGASFSAVLALGGPDNAPPLNAREGGGALLYLLLAGAACWGAVFCTSRTKLGGSRFA